ncbi:MAG TPA: hypothetical protein VJN21_03715 [Candidatus Acidoferrales bacterium]|nr:hypothetical protein [Candidatus Acidoferrales bacterium]
MPSDDENEIQPEQPDEEMSGGDELLYSIGEMLRAKQSKDAIAKLIEKFADDVPNRSKAQRHIIYWRHAVTAFIVVAIGVFGYLKIVSTETCGALLGGVIGGLYYSSRR